MGLSQKTLAAEIGVTQTAVCRLENGEEIYASALLAILVYLRKQFSVDYMLSEDFSSDSRWLNHHSEEYTRQFVTRHLDILRDAINTSAESCIQQLDFMKQAIME